MTQKSSLDIVIIFRIICALFFAVCCTHPAHAAFTEWSALVCDITEISCQENNDSHTPSQTSGLEQDEVQDDLILAHAYPSTCMTPHTPDFYGCRTILIAAMFTPPPEC